MAVVELGMREWKNGSIQVSRSARSEVAVQKIVGCVVLAPAYLKEYWYPFLSGVWSGEDLVHRSARRTSARRGTSA